MDQHDDDLEIILQQRMTRQRLIVRDATTEVTYEHYAEERMVIIRSKINGRLGRFQTLLNKCSGPIGKAIAEFHLTANDLDEFHRRTTIASISGGAVSIAGGITTLVGLILLPFTFGASIIVTAVGLGVGTAGGLAAASANVADIINARLDSKKVQEMLQTFQRDLEEMTMCLKDVQRLDAELRKLMRFHDCIELPALGQAIMRGNTGVTSTLTTAAQVAQLGRIATMAARSVRTVSALSGVLSGLVIVLDAALITRDAIHLHNGAKSDSGRLIREKADELKSIFQTLCENGEEMRRSASYREQYT